jgi:Flp pilus assembly protein TadD
MSKKGRRAKQKRRSSLSPQQESMEQVTSPEVDASPSAPPPPGEMVEAAPPETLTPSELPPQPETPLSFSPSDRPSVPPLEDSSYPPVDLDSRFFDQAPESEDTHERDPRMVLKLGPEAARRRAQFQRYVKIAVGAAAVLCLAALVKGAVARSHDEPTVHRTSAAVIAPPPAPAPPPVQTAAAAPEQARAPAEQQAAPVEPQANAAAETAAAAPSAAPADQPAAPPASAAAEAPAATAEAAPTDSAEAPAPDPKEAAKAKRASQTALERGKLADAIEAGERSVALDPTDAEAWLILGAAYQEKGDQKSARRSFKSCLEQSKRGPKWECAQMPH